MPFAAVGDLTLHYQDEGSATAPAVVFVNSLGTDLRIWSDVAAGLRDRFRVVRYDKRGHGLSDCPPGPYTVADHAADLAGLLDARNVAQAAIVGISVGGMIALSLAATQPRRVTRLVLCDTGARIGTAGFWAERIAGLEAGGYDALAETILVRWFAPDFAARRPADYCGYGNMLRRTPLAGYIATCAAIRDADLRPLLGDVAAPALVLCGAVDVATPPALSEALAAGLGAAPPVIIPDAAHLPCVEQPQRVLEEIIPFL